MDKKNTKDFATIKVISLLVTNLQVQEGSPQAVQMAGEMMG
jgi:hypothetical protein